MHVFASKFIPKRLEIGKDLAKTVPPMVINPEMFGARNSTPRREIRLLLNTNVWQKFRGYLEGIHFKPYTDHATRCKESGAKLRQFGHCRWELLISRCFASMKKITKQLIPCSERHRTRPKDMRMTEGCKI